MKNTRRNKIMSAAIWLIVLVSGTDLFVSAQTPTPQVNEIRELAAGQTLEREMTGAETHRYKFDLKKDEFFQVRVEQKGVDVWLRLVDASGIELARMDSPNSKDGPETLSFAADKAGKFILEISGFDAKAEKGNYTILRTASRNATAKDKRRIAVEKLFIEGMTARDTAGQGEIAIKKLEEALQGWRELQDEYLIQLTAQQVNQIKAARAKILFDEGFKLFEQGSSESLRAALSKIEEARHLYRDLSDKLYEGLSLERIGFIYTSMGEYEKALDYSNQALQMLSEIKDKSEDLKNHIDVLRELINALHQANCQAYGSLGEIQKELNCYNQKLYNSKIYDNKSGQTKTLIDISNFYLRLGENQKALEFLNQSLSLSKEINDKSLETEILKNFGVIYLGLGEYKRSLEYLNQALALNAKINRTEEFEGITKSREIILLIFTSKAYLRNGDRAKALETVNKALPLFRKSQNKLEEINNLMGIGMIYTQLGENQKALETLNQALLLVRENKDKSSEASILFGIADVYFYNLREDQKALEYYNQVLPLLRYFKIGEASTLNKLMYVWFYLGNKKLAIFYGKESINKYQELRQNIKGLDKEIQKTYLKSVEYIYRDLAEILIAEGRVAEAEQVLGMLKEEEFFEYLRRDDKAAKELKATIKLTPTEEEAFKRYEEIADEITRIGREFGELEKESKKFPVGKFPRQAEMDRLNAQLADARKVFNKFLEELDVRFRNKETREKDVRVAQISGTKALLDSLNQPRTVIISTIAGEDRLNLIVTTSKINRAHTVDIKAADLNKLVVEFRDAVKNPQVDPRPLGKKLYDVLFPADLQKDLAGVEADTIVWSLDGTLRYAPMSALWDGEKYLVERYSNAIITLASRDKIDKTPATRTNWTALGLGVSQKFENFDALTAVPQELCRVVQDERKKASCLKLTGGKSGVFGGVNLSDGEFTFESFRLHLGRYPIVHIASHFSLNAGTESDSYLLLGGGKTSEERKLSISAVREQLDTKFVGTELLVLSACNTAMSSGENSSGAEIEGFGALAQEQGAKTVLASLWAVADDSTRDLMTEFYEQLKQNPNTGKAEALRKSQIALLNGKYKSGETPLWRGTVQVDLTGKEKQPAFKTDDNAKFAHPFYWSPFILFGNWR